MSNGEACDNEMNGLEASSPPQPTPKLHELAASLMRVRGETLAAIAEATSIKTTNLSVWLRRGKEQLISATRIGQLMLHLGVVDSRLREDMFHFWRMGEKAQDKDLELIFKCALDQREARILFEERRPSLPETRVLMAGNVLIGVTDTPSLPRTLNLVEVFKPVRIVKVDASLSALSKKSLDTARMRLLELSENTLVFDSCRFSASLLRQFSNQAGQDWEPLRHALRRAISKGATPNDMARVIDEHFSGNANG